jgi:thiamine monophosphate synthase
MREVEARQLAAEIRELCKKHGVWLVIEEEHKPALAMIRVKEISIKVDK